MAITQQQDLIIALRAELNLLLVYSDQGITISRGNIERIIKNVDALAAIEGLDQHTSKVA